MQDADTDRYVRMRTLAARETGMRMFTFEGVRFTPARGWVRVSEEAAAYLALLRARPNDPDAPLAFDVWEPPPVHPAEDSAPRATLTDDAEGANAPSGRLLPPDARASAETREVRETAEGGSPSSPASARVEGSPPGAVPPDEGASPPQEHRLPPGDPAPAEALEAREIAEGSLPSLSASALNEGSSPDVVDDDDPADDELAAEGLPPDHPASAETHEVREAAKGGSPSSRASAREEGSLPDVVERGAGVRGGKAPHGGRGRGG